jgi:hypothetical protein
MLRILTAVIPIFLALLLALSGIYGSVKSRKPKRDSLKLNQDDLEGADELLFDSYTGKKITVEDATEGITITEEELNRIKTDEEILAGYSNLRQDEEFAQNHLRKLGFKHADNELDLNSILAESIVLESANDVGYYNLYALGRKSFIAFGDVSFYKRHFTLSSILLIVEGAEDLGNYLMAHTNAIEKWLSKRAGDDAVTSIDDYIIDRFRSTDKENMLIQFLSSLVPLGSVTLEVSGKYLFLFSYNHANVYELQNLMELYTKISKSSMFATSQ